MISDRIGDMFAIPARQMELMYRYSALNWMD